MPLVTPGPAVSAATPGWRVAFAQPSAANAADCSWRVSTMSIPSSRQPSKIEKMWPPESVNSFVTPWAFSRFATSRPPCTAGCLLLLGLLLGRHARRLSQDRALQRARRSRAARPAPSSTPDAARLSSTCSGREAPDDRARHVLLAQHPGDRELGHRDPQPVGDRPQPLHRLEHAVLHERPHEAGVGAGGARALGRLVAGRVLAGEHALRDRRPDDLADAELLARAGPPRPRSRGRASSTAAGWSAAGRSPSSAWMPRASSSRSAGHSDTPT